MSERLKVWAGALVILMALVGLGSNLRRFDRGGTEREVQITPSAWKREWHGGSVVQAAGLGRYELPAPGVLHVVVCPHPSIDPHAELRVSGAGLAHDAVESLTADETRGKRCFDASYTADRAQIVSAFVVLRTQGVPPNWGGVEVSASRRITPVSMWPVLALALGLGLIVVRRAGNRAGVDRAPVIVDSHPVYREPALGLQEDLSAAPSDQPEFAVPAPRGAVRWRFSWALALVALVATYIALAGFSVAYMVLTKRGSAALETGSFMAISLIVQHGLMILVAAWFLGALRSKEKRAALGLLPMTSREGLRAIVLGALLVGIAAAATHFIPDVSESPMGKLVERMPIRYVIGFGALLAPFSEELFFRGVLVPAFGKRSVAAGILGSAFVFTAAHALQLSGAWAGLIPIAAVGLVNGWLRAKSGGISQSWLVHTAYNAALSLGLYFE